LAVTHLPVFSVARKHQWIFCFADLGRFVFFDLLDLFLSLDSLIFGERTAMALLIDCKNKVRHVLVRAYSAGKGEKVRTGGLDLPHHRR
jgi:hypothetical protein